MSEDIEIGLVFSVVEYEMPKIKGTRREKNGQDKKSSESIT